MGADGIDESLLVLSYPLEIRLKKIEYKPGRERSSREKAAYKGGRRRGWRGLSPFRSGGCVLLEFVRSANQVQNRTGSCFCFHPWPDTSPGMKNRLKVLPNPCIEFG